MQDELEACKQKNDALEQYARRNTLELHGVPLTKGENTNDIAIDICASLGFNISFRDIDRSHRNGKGNRRRNIPPIILVKFVSHDLKEAVYESRNLLRRMPQFRGIFINENLTAVRRELFKTV